MTGSGFRQRGLTLVELLVAMAISVTVMGGVVSVVMTSKSNFITERELATLQENARYAIRFIGDEIRMAGFNGCSRSPLFTANTLEGSDGNWYLDGTGIYGFEHEAGAAVFPSEFRSGVLAGTDAIVVRRADDKGYSVVDHNPNSARFELNKEHDLEDGQIMVVADATCEQVGIFQISNANLSNVNIVHNTGNSVSPGNCTKALTGNFDCTSAPPPNESGNSYGSGSRVMSLQAHAFYAGNSGLGGNIPALFRERLSYSGGTAGTSAEELVQGVENLQILYGVDTLHSDGLADTYVKANSASIDWNDIVSVRIHLRMRSINPVYTRDEDYGTFQGITGTDGSDRFMRQVVTTTLQVRNGP